MNFEELGKKVKQISKDTVEEVQRLNEIRVLKGQVNDAKKQINGLYSEIGKRLYDQYKESPLDGFETEIHSITDKFTQIEEIKVQLRKVKGVVLCPCCNMEVAAGEKFCSNCGSQMPEAEPVSDDDVEIIIDAEEDDVVDVETGTVEDTEEADESTEEAADETAEASEAEAADETAAASEEDTAGEAAEEETAKEPETSDETSEEETTQEGPEGE
jgi:Zn finger protein HypA/HybF involved in hydrogenase expression